MSQELLLKLARLRTALDEINKLLEEAKNGSKKAMGEVAVKFKVEAVTLKEIEGDPTAHAPEVAKAVDDARTAMKDAFARAKAIKAEQQAAAPAVVAAPAVPVAPTAPVVPVVAPQVQKQEEVADEGARRRKEIEEKIAKDKKSKESEEKERKEQERKTQQEGAESTATKLVSSTSVGVTGDDEDEDEEGPATGASPGGAASSSLALPGGKMDGRQSGKDIWALVLKRRDEAMKMQQQQQQAAVGGEDSADEYTVIFVGGKSSGKSTLMAGFLDKTVGTGDQGEALASTALEYAYGRRTRGAASVMAREVVHCWEIAGGTRLGSLIEVCLTPQRVSTTTVVLVVDLSDPCRLMEVLSSWSDTIRARVDNCMRTLSKTDPTKRDRMSHIAASRYSENHPDRSFVKPLGVPAVLVGNKYDKFQDLDSEQRKVVSRTLRYFAHSLGMSLVYVVGKEEGKHMTRFRAHLNQCLFGTKMPDAFSAPSTAYTKPLSVSCGQDTLDAIGKPTGAEGGGGAAAQMATQLAWKEAFERVFPPKSQEETERVAADESDKYREPLIDTVVVEKEQEFARNQRLLAEATSLL